MGAGPIKASESGKKALAVGIEPLSGPVAAIGAEVQEADERPSVRDVLSPKMGEN